MNRLFALLAILVTTLVFTVIGAVVGYLISSSILQAAPHTVSDATFTVFTAYIICTLGGTTAGLAISCFTVWLVGTKEDN